MDDAETDLLRRVEELMKEVKTELQVSRDSRATLDELDRLRKDAADLADLRKRAAERRKRNRRERKSRDCTATLDKPAESQTTVSRDSRETSEVVKEVALAVAVDDRSQDPREEKIVQRRATVARQNGHGGDEKPVAPVWRAYSAAYVSRYSVKPVWNATVAGQLGHLIKRLGKSAAEVAAFYVQHNEQSYVRNRHPVRFLLHDAERLHTDWLKGEQSTATGARLNERTQHNANVFTPLLKGGSA